MRCWIFGLCLLGLTGTAWGQEFTSRYGFAMEIPDDWRPGLTALEAPGWGEMTPERREAVSAALTPKDAEVVLCASPEKGFTHMTVRESKETFPWNLGRRGLRKQFEENLTQAKLDEFTVGEIGERPYCLAVAKLGDKTVLMALYWQIAPERLITISLFGLQEQQQPLREGLKQITATLHEPKPQDTEK